MRWAFHRPVCNGIGKAAFVTAERGLYLTAGLESNFALTEDHQDAVVRVIER